MRTWCVWYGRPKTVMPRDSVRSVRFYRKWDLMAISYISPTHLIPYVTQQNRTARAYNVK